MPLYNAEAHLPHVLPPLLAEVEAGAVSEIIVVDDGSTDRSAQVCREAGLRVIPSGGRLGPGACRNVGVAAADSNVVLFVDSDVVIHPGVARGALGVLDADPELVAVFGSYDDRPAARSWVSTYRNLLHHHVHQSGREEASTFWAGLGAVRKAAYQEVGGFDAERFPRPCVEDIELGYRLRDAGGRIRLDKDLQCTHRKRWTLASMVRTDVFDRALPWCRLLRSRAEGGEDLNLSKAERAKALLGCLFWAALAAGLLWHPAFLVALALLICAGAANRRLFRLVYRRGGPGNMIVAVFLQQFYYLYSVLAWVYCRAEGAFRPHGGDPAPAGRRAAT